MLKSSLQAPQNGILSGDRDFADYVKMRVVVGALLQCDWCPYKERRCGHRDRRMQSGDKEQAHGEKTAQKQGPGTDPSPTALRRTPANTLILDL